MKLPVCIYLDGERATRAAAFARNRGASSTQLKVRSLPSKDSPDLFILEAPKDEREKVVDLIERAPSARSPLASDALRCPECGSIEIEPPSAGEFFPAPLSLNRLLHMLPWAGQNSAEPQFQCRNCDHLWSFAHSPANADRSTESAHPATSSHLNHTQ